MKFLSEKHKELYEKYSLNNLEDLIHRIEDSRYYNPSILIGIAVLILIIVKFIREMM